jgi:hypothetical protein
MNVYQVIVAIFGLIVLAISIFAVIVIARSPCFMRKPLWIIGSLFGFLGLGISWTSPDDLILLFGISIPVINVFKVLPAGPVIVKAFVPFVAIVALIKHFTFDDEAVD